MHIILSLCLLIKYFVYAWMSFFSSFLHMIFCMPNYFSLRCHLHFTQSSSFSLLSVITHNIIIIDILSYWNLFDLTCGWKLSKEIILTGWLQIGTLSNHLNPEWLAPNFSLQWYTESFIKIMRIKKINTNLWSSDCQMNSPCQYQRKCIEKSMENMDTDVRV